MAGNYASGRRRKRALNRIENYPALDINRLVKAGALRTGSPPTIWEWSNGATAVLVAEQAQFGELDVYYNRYGDDAWETQKVSVVCLPWRVGTSGPYGSRRYFECGICRRRVWRLHAVGGPFACKRCSRLKL